MNPNIEVITPELWGVNRSYVLAGWIKELPPSAEGYTNPYATLTNDGIMILNKDSEFYDILKRFVPKIMQHSDQELKQIKEKLERTPAKNNYKVLYLDVVRWELERWRVRAKVAKIKVDVSLLKRLLKIFRKEGE